MHRRPLHSGSESKPGAEPSATERVGRVAGFALAVLSAAYAAVLVIGLLTLPSPAHPIQDPWFTVMEVLILAIAPVIVAFSVGLHARACVGRKPVAVLGVVFMSMCAVVTSCVHFAVLTLSRHEAFAGADWSSLAFSFTWPSLAYALDILAWDVFFALGAFCAALTVPRTGRAGAARVMFLGSAMLAFVGLVGVPMASMAVRNTGIIGYVVLFPLGAALMAVDSLRQERRAT